MLTCCDKQKIPTKNRLCIIYFIFLVVGQKQLSKKSHGLEQNVSKIRQLKVRYMSNIHKFNHCWPYIGLQIWPKIYILACIKILFLKCASFFA